MTNVPPEQGDPPPFPPPWSPPQEPSRPPFATPPPYGSSVPGGYGSPPPFGAPPPYGAPPYGAPPAYGAPPYGAQVPYPGTARPTNGLAIASLVLGILWIFWLGSALAVIFGLVSLRQIRDSGDVQQGRGLAIAGLVLGLVGAVTLVFTIIVAAVGHGNAHFCTGAGCG